jgi:hypothetical protein
MKPCDCKNMADLKNMTETGLQTGDYAIIIEPPFVIIEFCNYAEMTIPNNIFDKLIMWYQENQNEIKI